MPFSSLKDPADVARAGVILDAAWLAVRDFRDELLESEEAARTRLAYIVAHLISNDRDDDEILRRAIQHFKE